MNTAEKYLAYLKSRKCSCGNTDFEWIIRNDWYFPQNKYLILKCKKCGNFGRYPLTL